MPKAYIYVADLTHTASGIASQTFPLGAACVAAYTKTTLPDVEIQVHKFPETLARACGDNPPILVGFSHYSWNSQLSRKLAAAIKKEFPSAVTVFGGPNFPVAPLERQDFLEKHKSIDFYIVHDGEVAFSALAELVLTHGRRIREMTEAISKIRNVLCLLENKLLCGHEQREGNLQALPSAYTSGLLDPFFNTSLSPLLETCRGCPFSCTFCADGLAIRNKVYTFSTDRFAEEIAYIAKRETLREELILADLNFGMLARDTEIAEIIERCYRATGWPKTVRATAGKNKSDRVLEVAKRLNGKWVIGAAIQSSSEVVQEKVRRTNIKTADYTAFFESVRSFGGAASGYTDIILGLPGDTKTAHIESLRFAIDHGVRDIRTFQATLLPGTEMATRETREAEGIDSRFRIMPGCFGEYDFFGRSIRIAEREEIVVATRGLSIADYVACRKLDLLLYVFYNSGLFDELFAKASCSEIHPLDLLARIMQTVEAASGWWNSLLQRFEAATVSDLYTSDSELDNFFESDCGYRAHREGQLGRNELKEFLGTALLSPRRVVAVFVKVFVSMLAERARPVPARLVPQLIDYLIVSRANLLSGDPEIIRSYTYDLVEWLASPSQVTADLSHVTYSLARDSESQQRLDLLSECYRIHPSGLGRFFQRENARQFFRQARYMSRPTGGAENAARL